MSRPPAGERSIDECRAEMAKPAASEELSRGQGENDFQKEKRFLETTEENCTTLLPFCDPLMAYREVKRWREMQANTYEDGCKLLERFEAQGAELAKVTAERDEMTHQRDDANTDVLILEARLVKAVAELSAIRAHLDDQDWPNDGESTADAVLKLLEAREQLARDKGAMAAVVEAAQDARAAFGVIRACLKHEAPELHGRLLQLEWALDEAPAAAGANLGEAP